MATAFDSAFETAWSSISSTWLTADPDPESADSPGSLSDLTDNDHDDLTDQLAPESINNVSTSDGAINVYFLLDRVNEIVAQDADLSAHFCIYAFSDQAFTDNLKLLWEGSTTESTGTLTGFEVQGVFDSGFFNQYCSASLDMTQVDGDRDQSTKWNNKPPAFFDEEDNLLHHKYMIVDVNSASDPFVVTGSMNWSANGDDTNDENTLIIHDAAIANQFYQEFAARYYMAFGVVDFLK